MGHNEFSVQLSRNDFSFSLFPIVGLAFSTFEFVQLQAEFLKGTYYKDILHGYPEITGHHHPNLLGRKGSDDHVLLGQPSKGQSTDVNYFPIMDYYIHC
jgi:hypothetical protein